MSFSRLLSCCFPVFLFFFSMILSFACLFTLFFFFGRVPHLLSFIVSSFLHASLPTSDNIVVRLLSFSSVAIMDLFYLSVLLPRSFMSLVNYLCRINFSSTTLPIHNSFHLFCVVAVSRKRTTHYTLIPLPRPTPPRVHFCRDSSLTRVIRLRGNSHPCRILSLDTCHGLCQNPTQYTYT